MPGGTALPEGSGPEASPGADSAAGETSSPESDGGPGRCAEYCRAACKEHGKACLTACARREGCREELSEAGEPNPCRTPPMRFSNVPKMEDVVRAVASEVPEAFANVCFKNADWVFIDRLVDQLRELDPRWGYLCRRGNCSDLKDDVIAFYAGPGAPRDGSPDVRFVDVILDCGFSNKPQWLLFCHMPSYNGLWKKRR